MFVKKPITISINSELSDYITKITSSAYKTLPKNQKEIQQSKDLFQKQLENFKKLNPAEAFCLGIQIELLEYEHQFQHVAALYHQIFSAQKQLEKSKQLYIDCTTSKGTVSSIYLKTNAVIDFSLISELNNLSTNSEPFNMDSINYQELLILSKKHQNHPTIQFMLFMKSSLLLNTEFQQFDDFCSDKFVKFNQSYNKTHPLLLSNHFLFMRSVCYANEILKTIKYFSSKGVFFSIYNEFYIEVEKITEKYFQSKDMCIIPQTVSDMKATLYQNYYKNSMVPHYVSLIPDQLKTEFEEKYDQAIALANQLIANGKNSKKPKKQAISPDIPLPPSKSSDKGKKKEVIQITETLATTSLSVKKDSQIEQVQQKLALKEHHQYWTKELPRIRRFENLIGLDAPQFREKALSFTDNGELRYPSTITNLELFHDFNCHAFPFVEFLVNHTTTFHPVEGGYFAYAQLITPQGKTLTGVIEIGIDQKEKVLVHRYFKPFNSDEDTLTQLFPKSIDIQHVHGSESIFEAPEESHQTTWSNLHFSMIDNQVLSIQDKTTNLTLQVFI